MSDNPQDHELAHYGIKGMKWGIRRKTNSEGLVEKSSSTKQYSEDALNAEVYKERARTRGVQSLHNKELQALNERLNLEANYGRLTATGTKESSAVKKGEAVFSGMKKAIDIGNDVYRMYNSPAVKLVREQVKNARG